MPRSKKGKINVKKRFCSAIQYIASIPLGGADMLHVADLTWKQGQFLSRIGPFDERKLAFLPDLSFLETPDCGIIRQKGKTLFDAARTLGRKEKPSRRAFGQG